MVSAILLAAGESRRMGEQNKLLLPFRNSTFIAHIADQLLHSEAEEVLVVLGHQAEEVQDVLTGRPLRFVHNPDYPQGMTTSIRAGVRAASPNSQGYMICLSDLPFVEASDYTELIRTFNQLRSESPNVLVRPAWQGKPGNPVLFSSEYRDAILTHPKMEGCRGLIREHAECVRLVEMPNDHTLRDIDTPEEYERFLSDDAPLDPVRGTLSK